jgi:hypothetical protein
MVEGSALEVGDIIGNLTLDDPSMVKKAVVRVLIPTNPY